MTLSEKVAALNARMEQVNLQFGLMQDAIARGDQEAWKAAMTACQLAIGKLGRLAFP